MWRASDAVVGEPLGLRVRLSLGPWLGRYEGEIVCVLVGRNEVAWRGLLNAVCEGDVEGICSDGPLDGITSSCDGKEVAGVFVRTTLGTSDGLRDGFVGSAESNRLGCPVVGKLIGVDVGRSDGKRLGHCNNGVEGSAGCWVVARIVGLAVSLVGTRFGSSDWLVTDSKWVGSAVGGSVVTVVDASRDVAVVGPFDTDAASFVGCSVVTG